MSKQKSKITKLYIIIGALTLLLAIAAFTDDDYANPTPVYEEAAPLAMEIFTGWLIEHPKGVVNDMMKKAQAKAEKAIRWQRKYIADKIDDAPGWDY